MPSADQTTWARYSVVGLVLATVLFVASRTVADPDLWGHVRFGQDILASGAIPDADPYSYLSGGQPWINHEWLTEVIFGAVFNWFGVAGLVVLKTALILLTLGLAYRHLSRQGLDPLRAGMVVLAVMVLMSVGLGTVRPQLFTYLLFGVTLWIIHAGEGGSTTALAAAPAVILLWVNLHGGVLAGLGVLGIWAAAHALLRGWRKRQEAASDEPQLALILASLAASGLAALMNPYGIELIVFLLRTATVPRPEIGEWHGITVVSQEGAAYLVVLSFAVIALLYSPRPRRPALLVVFACTALLPLQAVRHLPLFALSFAFLAGEHLAGAWLRWSPRPENESAGSKRPLLPALAAAGALLFVVLALPHFRCIRLEPSYMRFPVRAVALLEKAGALGNLATFFDWGEYIIWRLSPKVRVSIDGRRETVYAESVYEQNLAFLFGVADWDAILEDTDMALVLRDQPAYNLLKLKSGWLLSYEDSLSALFAREGSAQAQAISNTQPPDLPPDGKGLCFP